MKFSGYDVRLRVNIEVHDPCSGEGRSKCRLESSCLLAKLKV